MTAPARVLSVNVGRPAWLRPGPRPLLSAIVKTPVDGPVRAYDDHLAGDEQADKENHGGRAQAVYAYASEDAGFWEAVLGRELGPAFFGENLTTAGLEVTGARIGERWRVGSAELRVTCPRIPCAKLAARVGDPRFLRAFVEAGRPGAYLAIEREGVLRAGEEVEVVHRPEHAVTVGLMAEALLLDPARLDELEPARADFEPKVAEFVDSRRRGSH